LNLERRAIACAKIRYHLVFCVKYRRKLLRDVARINYLKNVCSEIGERYWFDFDAIGTDGDHVHIFVGAAPRYSPSKVMQIIKSITAREFLSAFQKSGNSFGEVNFGATVDM
jgi:putative transposase